MVKKMKSSGSAAQAGGTSGLMDSHLAHAVKDSAQQIWLAGMGAFSKAQEEGGKVFDALVKEGMSLQKKTQGMAEEKIGEVTGRMTAMADTVTAKAGQNWDKLESIFEARTAKAMHKLGVPTAKDVQALAQRVDELAAAVARLNGAPVARKASARGTRQATPAGNGAAKTTARKARVSQAAQAAQAAEAAAPKKRTPRRRAAA